MSTRRIKVAEATGPVLDHLVHATLGLRYRYDFKYGPMYFMPSPTGRLAGWESSPPLYSTDWAQGGPIIERERITLRVSTMPGIDWVAFYDVPGEYHARIREKGPTALIAAMRCYVASRLGAEVEVPEELL